ncbi:hypothetical protein [Streptomyces sp. Qhu_M48]|uniref:hypothetical protein n=1 Tax=Streptomyces sp. Qhu_M48 TaxID=3435889 RepID=UPI003F4F87A5
MGYDIYIQGRDGKSLLGPENYIRFTYFQMPGVLDAMDNFGMTVEVAEPTYPKLADFQLSREDFGIERESHPEVKERIDAFRDAYQAVKDAADEEPTAIPRYKLAFNAGFLVTVPELAAALRSYEAHPSVDIAEMPLGDPTWRTWTAFLRRAKTYGGLRTH